MSVQVLDRAAFEQKVLAGGDKPVLVDFFATWCGPCKMLHPVIEQVEAETAGSAEVYQVDIDQESDLAAQYGVMSVPTLIVFKNGKPVNQSLGFMPKERVLALIQNS
ncbi:thioredoxin [Neobittarella massiliensis]|uniref:Thioredoxin n=2 Tax=Oscillospiraceae TaxID=216572 RepID=A0A8J6IMC6_9FIRM|nr:thioredoxin [Neobittarella massiliensis]MBC3516344.1 thioredoxin [Neobittarella massiliensis]SCJ87427.1 Thioredoxin [uncultured Anaerotruncus sp.]